MALALGIAVFGGLVAAGIVAAVSVVLGAAAGTIVVIGVPGLVAWRARVADTHRRMSRAENAAIRRAQVEGFKEHLHAAIGAAGVRVEETRGRHGS